MYRPTYICVCLYNIYNYEARNEGRKAVQHFNFSLLFVSDQKAEVLLWWPKISH